MQREIKFRAWDGDKKEMHLPEYTDPQNFHIYADGKIVFTEEYGYERHELTYGRPESWILMQFTGFHDKNKKDIYEGDIINFINVDGNSINTICKFGIARREIFENVVDIMGFYFELPDGRKTFPIVNNYAGKHDLELFEVIGNIYQNPELCKEK